MRKEHRNYLIMFLLLGVSGFPFFTARDIYIIAFSGLLFLFFLFEKRLRLDKEFVILLGAALLLVFCQAIFKVVEYG